MGLGHRTNQSVNQSNPAHKVHDGSRATATRRTTKRAVVRPMGYMPSSQHALRLSWSTFHLFPFTNPTLLETLCAFADELAQLPDPRDPHGVRYPLAVLLGTLLVALAGGADTMVAVAEFTVDHQAWFRRWLPLGASVPTDDTYRLLVRRLEPETAMKAALLLLDDTCLPGLRQLILALDGKVARRSDDRAAGTRPCTWSVPSWCRRG